jgi:DNA invertase Pin-like site-specific DNA recombinase
MNVVGYCRVSTKDQDLTIQMEAIKRLCEYRKFNLLDIYMDKASGKNVEREYFQKMLAALKNNTKGIEGIVIYKLDRIGRSIRNLLDIIDFLNKADIQLITVTENIDTTTAQGRLFFSISAAFAEYERELINERSQAGIKRARENHVKFGRPLKVIKLDEIRHKLALGVSKSRICKEYGIGRSTLYKKLDENKEVI